MTLPEIVYVVPTPHYCSFLNDEHLKQISALVAQLGPNIRAITWDWLHRVIAESKVAVAQERETEHKAILGVACLAPVTTLTRRIGIITHISVQKEYQRCGIGAGLIRRLLCEARSLHLTRLDLTSQAKRAAAQEFWIKQGFKKRETNNFRLELG